MTAKSSILPDLFITLPAILLIIFSVVVIFTSNDLGMAMQQLIIGVVGLALYWAVSFIDVEYHASYIWILYTLTFMLLVVVFILGYETRGSMRWIPIGPLRLQPSELAKPVLIIFLARFWQDKIPTWSNILKSLLLISPILGLVFKQPDLGTTIVLVVIWLMILLGANISVKKIGALTIFAGILAPITWALMKDYQRNRIFSFMSPESAPLETGYNAIQSMIAVGSGQFFGRGLGRGPQSRLQFLPEYRTDFIFASIAEELGFVGSMIVLFLYGTLISRIIIILRSCRSRYSSLVCMGVLGMILIQTVVNIGMNIGVMPITGITLPLLSYGGSSLVITLLSLGFVAAVSRYSSHRLD